MNYVLDRESGELVPNPAQEFLAMEPGSGPRHLAFHPNGKFVYILNELKATVVACSFNKATGKLTKINTRSIVEEGFEGNRQSAAIRVHPNGKFVYATNRDDASSLAVFTIAENGGLNPNQLVQDVPYWPRDFNLTPDGKHLLVAGARANEIALYAVNTQTGKLQKQQGSLSLPGPISIVFIP
jgi:6-phosphogluconolactonase